jgi:peptidoglycan/xylan/chitin deacetylase (PgdA/CDA1 family)
MKKLLVLGLLISVFVQAQDSLNVEITNWKNGKKAAIVFSFDDWSPGHGSIVYPLFKKNNVPATFYVTLKNKQYAGGFATMREAYNDGFEIGNHTETHPDLTLLSKRDLSREISGTQKILQDSVHPKCAVTIAYPFGIFNDKVFKEVKKSHIGGRLATLRYGRVWPYSLTYGKTDYFQLQTFMARDIYTPSMFERLTKQAINEGGMITFMYHSIFNDSIDDHWFGAISEQLLNAHLQAVKKHEDQVWITSFVKAVKYHKEKLLSDVSFTKTGNQIIIDLKCTTEPLNFNEPLTLRISGIEASAVKSARSYLKDSVSFEIQSDNSTGDILINVSPISQKIIIQL